MEIVGLFKAGWTLQGQSPYIYLFTRTKDRKKDIKIIKDFKPYIYVEEKAKNFLLKNSSWVTKVEDVDRLTIDKKKVVKATLINPRLAYEIKKRFDAYESDLLFHNRFLIDHNVNIVSGDYKRFYFDIETTTDKGFPYYKNPIEKITLITFTTNYSDDIITLLLSPNKKDRVVKVNKNYVIYEYSKEEMMLEAFIDMFRKIDCDLILGWNVSFDISYLLFRMKALRINYNRLANIGSVRIGKESRWGLDIDIFDKTIFDLLDGYKHIVLDELPSYSLDYVSKVELGDDGGKNTILDMSDAWRNHTAEFIKYNKKDVTLIKTLDLKVGIVDYAEEIKNLGMLTDLNSSFFFSRVIDNIMLKKFGNQFVFIDKSHEEGRRVGIKGGFVKEPVRGLHKWVLVVDYSAMYPSIVKTFNLSYDTVNVENVDIIINTDEENESCKVINLDLSTKGWLPQVLDDMIEWREYYKKRMKELPEKSKEWRECDLKQFAAKFLINASAYGVMANQYFRLYKPQVAALITFLGRTVIQKVADKVEEKDKCQVVYGDSVANNSEIIYYENNILKRDTIENMYNKYGCKPNNLFTYTVNENKKVILSPIKTIIRKPSKKKMYKIKGMYNKEIMVTEDHSIFVYEDDKIVIKKPTELKVKDKIITPLTLPNKVESKNLSKCMYKFLGVWLADGSYNGASVDISGREHLETIKEISKEYKCTYYIQKNEVDMCVNCRRLVDKMVELGFNGKSATKRVPEWIFNETKENIKLFLSGLLNGDGSINKYCQIMYDSINADLVKDAQILFNMINIPSSFMEEGTPNSYPTKDKIYSNGSVSKRLDVPAQFNPLFKDMFLECKSNYSVLNKYEVFKNRRQITNKDLFIIPIKKIEEVEYKDKYVYDLSIPKYEKFFANDLLVHNTDSLFVDVSKFEGINLNDLNKEERDKRLKYIVDAFVEKTNIYTKQACKNILGEHFKEENYHMRMTAEKIFDKVLLCRKKKYAGNYYWKDYKFYDKPYYKFVGIDIRRNNIPEIVKDGLRKFIDYLFLDKDYMKLIKDKVEEIKTSTDISLFTIPLKIEKIYNTNVPQQRAADYANKKWKLGFKTGSKYLGLYVKEDAIGTDIVGFDIVERLDDKILKNIDREKYVNMFVDKIKLMYDLIDIDLMLKNQTKLSIFMSE